MKRTATALLISCSLLVSTAHAQNMNRPTDEQVRSYVRKFADPAASPALQALINSARERASLIISTQACYKSYDPSSLLGRYVVAGQDPVLTIASPMWQVSYHDKNTCMSVDRIDNFSAPAKNALSFRVVFVSESSGESRSLKYTLVKQSDGEWLIKHAAW